MGPLGGGDKPRPAPRKDSPLAIFEQAPPAAQGDRKMLEEDKPADILEILEEMLLAEVASLGQAGSGQGWELRQKRGTQLDNYIL